MPLLMAKHTGNSAPLMLTKLRERAGLSMEEMARLAGYKYASGVQRYENPDQYTKLYFPLDLTRKFAKALVGRGDPKITADEVFSELAGVSADAGSPMGYRILLSGESPSDDFAEDSSLFQSELLSRLMKRFPRSEFDSQLLSYVANRGTRWFAEVMESQGATLTPEEAAENFVRGHLEPFMKDLHHRKEAQLHWERVPIFKTVPTAEIAKIKIDRRSAVDRLQRPAVLSSAVDIYAFYVSGDWMAEAFRASDIAIANPHVPAKIGNYVLAHRREIRDALSPTVAYLGRLVGRTSDEIALETLNPRKEIELSPSEIDSVDLVYHPADLLKS